MKLESSGFLPPARREGVISKEADGELLIYDRDNDRAHCLNESAAAVWKLCDGQTSAADIARKLSAQNGHDSNSGEDFGRTTNSTRVEENLVWFALEELRKASLLEERNQPWENKFLGMSRREAVRRIALGTAIAVPAIASIVVPMPVDAVSCGATCAPCTTSAQCCRVCGVNVPGCGSGRSCT